MYRIWINELKNTMIVQAVKRGVSIEVSQRFGTNLSSFDYIPDPNI